MEQKPKPSFMKLYAESLADGLRDEGISAIVPYWLIGSMVAGLLIAALIPEAFWANDHWGISTATLSGLLAFNGILLALGWFAFAKIYEVLSNSDYGHALSKEGLLGEHLMFIQYNHLVMILASLATGAALFMVLMNAPILMDRLLLGVSVGSTIYSFVRALESTSTMNELVWEQAEYRMKFEKPKIASVK